MAGFPYGPAKTFCCAHSCTLASGAYPSTLLEQWDRWEAAEGTFNDRPTFYDQDALHVILVMEYGGLDLEHFALDSMARVRSVLLQVLSAVALAEDKLQFEHRDLHLGNVLVKESHRDSIQLGNYQAIPTAGIVTSIIDCSLSRFRAADGGGGEVEEDILFRNLNNDAWLFTGDAGESRQYQVYRDMRDLLQSGWQQHQPRSNLLWITYIAEELLQRGAKLGRKEPTLHQALLEFSQKLNSGAFSCAKEAFTHLYRLE